MIGIDWGTTSLRAWRIGPDGTIRARRESAQGIMAVGDGRFAETLRREIEPWLADGESRVLMSGMIGSRQGWVEAPYLPCPSGPAELAAALVLVPFAGAAERLVPGLSGVDDSGVAEVMRGEETQIAGAVPGDGLVCLPGTHSKWARVVAGRITGFSTFMTGEMFAALRGHTILGRLMEGGPSGGPAFEQGVRRAGDPGGLTHHAFGVRALTLAGRLAEADGADYLSGLLIGHELRAALTGEPVTIIGAPALTALYARAIALCGAEARPYEGDAAARGLALIGEHTSWT